MGKDIAKQRTQNVNKWSNLTCTHVNRFSNNHRVLRANFRHFVVKTNPIELALTCKFIQKHLITDFKFEASYFKYLESTYREHIHFNSKEFSCFFQNIFLKNNYIECKSRHIFN